MIFASWRYNFSTQPEVEERKKRNRKRIVSYPEDDLFAAWRHNLVEAPLPQYGPEVRDSSPEDYFSSWYDRIFMTTRPKKLYRILRIINNIFIPFIKRFKFFGINKVGILTVAFKSNELMITEKKAV